jgi:hypothetical protein
VQQDLLAALQLRGQTGQRPLGQVAIEVGHHAHGVREAGAVLERAAALVVDEHEVHRVRAVRGRQRGHEGLQQLGLTGAGGAGDQPVRSVTLEVDAERAVIALADHRDRGDSARLPAPGDHFGGRGFKPQHVEQPAGRRKLDGVLLVGGVAYRG